MKQLELPLSQLTLPEKLHLLETIWADLCRNEEGLESPAWHEMLLKDREAALAAGEETVSSWEDAKESIRRKVS